MVEINENTLRDGSYKLDFDVTPQQTFEITKALDMAGFGIIEFGHGLGLGAYRKLNNLEKKDAQLIDAAVKAKENAELSVFFIPGIGTKEDIKQASKMGIELLRIGVNINEYKKTRHYLEYDKELGMKVAFNGMKSYAVKSYEFSKISVEIDSWELADMIYLVDSAGCMTPTEVKKYISETVSTVPTPIGFHGHNNLSLAAINSITAVESGATYIDTCIRGMGRSAGNAQTEIVIILLQKIGLYDHIDIYELYKIANSLIEPLMIIPQGFNDQEIHTGLSKFHSSYMPLIEKYSEKYGVKLIKLMKEVSDVNCLDPDSNLIKAIAKEL